jgi:hypothetical protein
MSIRSSRLNPTLSEFACGRLRATIGDARLMKYPLNIPALDVQPAQGGGER